MLEARDLTKRFPSGGTELVVFEHLSFQVRPGSFIGFTGRSGSGKSTLLYQLGLLDTPSGGSVIIDNTVAANLTFAQRSDLRLRMFGYVFQDYGLLPEMTAEENVMLPLLMQGFTNGHARKMAQDALARVGLAAREGFRPGQLSGGQQQRVSIARAIAHSPTYLIADEPTANLDSTTASTILQVFYEIHAGGTTVLMATHERDSLARADEVFEFSNGSLVSVQTRTPEYESVISSNGTGDTHM